MSNGYETYRPSTIPWIDELPVHWETRPLLAVAQERDVRNIGLVEENLLSLSYGNIVRKDISSSEGLLPESFETYQIVEPNDVIFRLTDLQNDKRSLRTGQVRERGIITSAYLAVEPTGIHPSYLSYLLRAYDLSKVFYSMGGGLRQSMKYSDVRRMPMLVPPLPEQAAIAAFLDRETAKIDALVEEQKRLIDLLKEKRQAVISHAVTKGLNSDAPMKDTGIEWLGEVPEHWEVAPLKHVATHVVDCLHTTPTYDGELAYPAIRTADVERGRLLLEQARLVSEEVYTERVQRLEPIADDILYSREGERLGMAALVPENVKLCLGQRMMMFRVSSQNSAAFIMWTLNSEYIYQQVVQRTGGATSPHLNISDCINFRFALPPKAEQQAIALHISGEVKKTDELISGAIQASEILAERRHALISAAVTGKIEVLGTSDEHEVAA